MSSHAVNSRIPTEIRVSTLDESRTFSSDDQFKLLENGEEYFPAVFAAVNAAKSEIVIETFILFEDTVGNELQAALIAAAQRGVSVDLTIDGYGSPDLSKEFVDKMAAAGIRLHIFDPRRRFLGMRTNLFRRLHRKIVAVDDTVAFIGGINFSADHLLSFGAEAKQDYAVRIEGPLAQHICHFARQQTLAFNRPSWPNRRRKRLNPQMGKSFLIVRDNESHRSDIERHYRAAILAAKHEIVIACAYFFPGYKFLHQLRRAARRGVKVKLILQGAPDMPQVKSLTTMLYPSLLRAGVKIHEYCQRPLHAKVAVIDDAWSTIGSSNLDPLSLALNLEANVVIRDRTFNRELRARLQPLLDQHCKQVDQSVLRGGTWLFLCNFFAYHCTRHFPRWAGWLPAHLPKLRSITQPKPGSQAGVGHNVGVVGDDCRH